MNGACKRAGVPRIYVHRLRHTFRSQTAMAGADPIVIMKAIGHTGIKTTMIYVSLDKSYIREQVDKINAIRLLPLPAPRMKALPAPARANSGRSFAQEILAVSYPPVSAGGKQ
jgi:hypothetical protein